MPVCRPPRVEVARVAAVLGADQRGSRPGAHRRRASSRARPADTGTAAHRAADRPPAAGEPIPLADPASGARPGRHVDLDAGRAECGSRARFARRRSGTSTKTASKPAKRPAAKSAAQVGVRSTPASGGTPASGTLPSGLSGNPLLATGGLPSQLSGQAMLGDLLSPMLAGPAPEQVAAPDLATPWSVSPARSAGGIAAPPTRLGRTTIAVIAVVALASVLDRRPIPPTP